MSSTLLSVIKMRCPRCHKGKLFVDPNPYHLSRVSKMHQKCSCCGQLTEPEPAFYYGAMYVSYGLSILLCFINFFIVEAWLGIEGVRFHIVNTIVLIAFWPVIFRYARVLYIYMFIRYNPNHSQ